MKADGTKKLQEKKNKKTKTKGCTGKKYAQRERVKGRKKERKKKENRQCLQNS